MACPWILGYGYSRSLEMAPFDRSHLCSYRRSVITMALSCVISEVKRDITDRPKIAIFFTPHLHYKNNKNTSKIYIALGILKRIGAHSTPPLAGSPSDYCHNVWYGKIEWSVKLPPVKKFEYNVYPTKCTVVTDGQTDTERRHRPHYAQRGATKFPNLHPILKVQKWPQILLFYVWIFKKIDEISRHPLVRRSSAPQKVDPFSF